MRSALSLILFLFLVACTAPPEPVSVETIALDAPSGSLAPSVAIAADGAAVISWVERGESASMLRYRHLGHGGTRTAAEGAGWFVNWADFPSVTVTPDGRWMTHYLEQEGEDTYAYGVRVVTSSDGETWSAPVTPHTDGTLTEHGFVSHYPTADGFGLVWLDGRMMAEGGGGHGSDTHGGHGGGGMTLRHAVLGGEGLTEELQLDGLVCDCCQTDAALATEGPVVAYRDRSEGEIRDTRVVRRTADGWSDPIVVHADDWRMDACPVNGPAIAADGQRVAVAWFTAAGGSAQVLFAESTDGGASFGPPVQIDTMRPIGRIDLAATPDGTWLTAWYGRSGDGSALLLREVRDGVAGEPFEVARVSETRRSGFPRMAYEGEDLVIAWTAVEDEVTQVQAARISGLH